MNKKIFVLVLSLSLFIPFPVSAQCLDSEDITTINDMALILGMDSSSLVKLFNASCSDSPDVDLTNYVTRTELTTVINLTTQIIDLKIGVVEAVDNKIIRLVDERLLNYTAGFEEQVNLVEVLTQIADLSNKQISFDRFDEKIDAIDEELDLFEERVTDLEGTKTIVAEPINQSIFTQAVLNQQAFTPQPDYTWVIVVVLIAAMGMYFGRHKIGEFTRRKPGYRDRYGSYDPAQKPYTARHKRATTSKPPLDFEDEAIETQEREIIDMERDALKSRKIALEAQKEKRTKMKKANEMLEKEYGEQKK